MKEQEEQKPLAIITDLDGTLCDISHRRHHIVKPADAPRDWRKNWNAFIAGIPGDTPNRAVLDLIQVYQANPKRKTFILAITGRYAIQREATASWLNTHNITIDALFMRKDNDSRHDYEVKEEIYRRDIEPYYDVLFVLEDRDRLVEHYRSLGLTCFQVGEGAF